MKEQLVYDNIFDAICDDQSEAADMQFRSDLMIVIRQVADNYKYTPKDLESVLGVSQPRVSELLNGKIEKCSSDKLLSYLAKLGFRIRPSFSVACPTKLQVQVQVDAHAVA